MLLHELNSLQKWNVMLLRLFFFQNGESIPFHTVNQHLLGSHSMTQIVLHPEDTNCVTSRGHKGEQHRICHIGTQRGARETQIWTAVVGCEQNLGSNAHKIL
jgi:hypothetical protein